MMAHRARLRLSLVGILISLGLVACGCGGGKDGPKESEALAYPSSLSSASTPSDVASVLIQALDEDDTETLMGLVATKNEMAAIDAIYRKYGKKSPMTPGDAAAAAAAGWRATYAFFESGATQVADKRIEPPSADGVETATVTASGKNASTGEPRLLTIHLITEDDLWKVQAGLDSSDASYTSH